MGLLPVNYVETSPEPRVSAWHKIGITLPLDTKPSEAIKILTAKNEIKKYPAGYLDAEGMWHETNACYLVVNGEPLKDTVSPEYVLQSYQDRFSEFDKLDWQFETAGLLGKGEKIFLLLKISDNKIKIAGDEYVQFLYALDDHSGKCSWQVGFSTVRIVCQNTLTLALSEQLTHISGRHTVSDEKLFIPSVQALKNLIVYQEQFVDNLDRMSKFRLSVDGLLNFAESIFTLPQRASVLSTLSDVGLGENEVVREKELNYTKKCITVENRRAAFIREYKNIAQEESKLGSSNNLLRAVQAVSAWSDHSSNKIGASALFGDRAIIKARAIKLANELIGVS